MIEKFALKDKYLIEKKLQESKLGKTFLAKSNESEDSCIIKTVRINKSESSDKILAIQNEAKVLSNLNHKNIPKLIEIFTQEDDNKINIFLVQKYIPGSNLQELIDKGQKFSQAEVIKIGIKICNILDYIHSFSPEIIHQDIKPANIILSEDGEINLIDFGAVKQKILTGDNQGLSTIIGTQGYMSLEQFEGNAVPASDIYSLGLTMLALITGKHPLLLDKKGLVFDFKDLKVSKDLKVILEKMTNPDWRKRYKSANELKNELEFFISNENGIEKSFWSKKSINKIVKEQIAPDEKLKFFKKSRGFIEFSGANVLKSLSIYTLGVSIIMFILLLYIFVILNDQSLNWQFLMLLLSILMVSSFLFLKEINFFKRKIYIITNKRVMIIDSETNYRKVESYNNQDIKAVRIISTYSGNYGDLFVVRNNEQSFVIKKIDNIDIVYKLLKEIADKNELSE